jgi:hypothetical protein
MSRLATALDDGVVASRRTIAEAFGLYVFSLIGDIPGGMGKLV